MVHGRSFNLPAFKCLYRSVADPGEGPGGPASLTFGPNCGPKGREKNFFRPPHPPYLRVWMTGLPLIWRFGSANAGTLQRPSNFPITIVPSVASGISSLNHLHHFPKGLTPQTDSVWEWCPFLVQFQLNSSWILVKTYCQIKIVELAAFRVGVR